MSGVRIVIVGAGPIGLVLGAALARRGCHVAIVDRDPGPDLDGRWPRRGVMQFHHAHGMRPAVTEVLATELPEALALWSEAGAKQVYLQPPGSPRVLHVGTKSRRETLERAVRSAAASTAGVAMVTGHVREVTCADGRASGVRLDDGRVLPADLVVDASGRSSHVADSLPAPAQFGGSCGLAYVDRQYRLHDPDDTGPLLNPVVWQADFDGYQTIVFPHEHGLFSVLIVRGTADRRLAGLREEAAFEAAAAAIPGLTEWTDPARSRPVTPVLAGGTLRNHYRSQRTPSGALVAPGLIGLGDRICTTTPTFGRGLALGMMQVRTLLRLVDGEGFEGVALGESFDDWCEVNMRPWVEDHLAMDEGQRRRWLGEDLDLGQPLPSDLILAAAAVDPSIAAEAGGYLTLGAGPDSLRRLQARARAVYATGWRPPLHDGPRRDELAAIIASASASRR